MAAVRDAVEPEAWAAASGPTRPQAVVFVLMVGAFVVARFVVYPVFLMKALCFALFACAFILLTGYGGLLSFGHAAYLGSAGYVTAHAAKVWGWPPELAILAGVAGGGGRWGGIRALRLPPPGVSLSPVTPAPPPVLSLFGLPPPAPRR